MCASEGQRDFRSLSNLARVLGCEVRDIEIAIDQLRLHPERRDGQPWLNADEVSTIVSAIHQFKSLRGATHDGLAQRGQIS